MCRTICVRKTMKISLFFSFVFGILSLLNEIYQFFLHLITYCPLYIDLVSQHLIHWTKHMISQWCLQHFDSFLFLFVFMNISVEFVYLHFIRNRNKKKQIHGQKRSFCLPNIFFESIFSITARMVALNKTYIDTN